MEGFGNNKSDAIKLLKQTISILDEFNINHMLISGTLLGYIRHNDFIPWDDDMDILTDYSIYSKLSDISLKYPNINIFSKNQKYNCIKFCFNDGMEIPENPMVLDWKRHSVSNSNKYCWPFIDIFTYEDGPGIHNCNRVVDDVIGGNGVKVMDLGSGDCRESFRFFSKDEISFFHNDWKRTEFFPLRRVNFLGIDCNIPNNPHYFLSVNFGNDYMVEKKEQIVVHKKEQII